MVTAIGQLFDVYYKEFRPHSEYQNALEEARVAGMEEAGNSIAGSLKKGLKYADAVSGNSQLEQACQLQDGDTDAQAIAKNKVWQDLEQLSGILEEARDIPASFSSIFANRQVGYQINNIPVFCGNVDSLLALGPQVNTLHNISDKLNDDIGRLAASMGSESEVLISAVHNAAACAVCMRAVAGPLREHTALIENAVDEYIARHGEESPTATLMGVYHGVSENRVLQPDTIEIMLQQAQEAGNILRQTRPTDPNAQAVATQIDEVVGIFVSLTGTARTNYDGQPVTEKLRDIIHDMQAVRLSIYGEGNAADSPQAQAEKTISSAMDGIRHPIAGNYRLDQLIPAAAAEQARERRMEAQVANALGAVGVSGGAEATSLKSSDALVQRLKPPGRYL